MFIDLQNHLIFGVDRSGIPVAKPIPPATEKEVIGFEESVGYTLPDDYRNFLLTVNGGAVNKNTAKNLIYHVEPLVENTVGHSGEFELGYMYSLFEGDKKLFDSDFMGLQLRFHHDILLSMSEDGFEFVPDHCVPIADYFGAAYLLLALDGTYKNKILFYGFNMGKRPNAPYDNVGLVADNFAEFIASLKIDNG